MFKYMFYYSIIYKIFIYCIAPDFSWYSKKSVEMAKTFIQNCVGHIGSNSYLWIAFQSNALFEKVFVHPDFNKSFEDMVDDLSNSCRFYWPKMYTNMRNSREISEFTKGVQRSTSNIMKKDLFDASESRTSSVISREPIVWPIKTEDLETRFDDLLSSALDENEINVILFTNEKNLSAQRIKQSLIKHGIDEENILIHSLNSKTTKEEIRKFFMNPNGFLICQDECFIGMEAYGIIYCLGDEDASKSFRCHLMRATSELNIIYAVADNPCHIDFGASSLLSPQFLECDKIMKTWANKCRQCDNEMVICKPCLIACHNGHMKKRRNGQNFGSSEEYFIHVQSKLSKNEVNCECKEKSNVCVLRCE